jgi:hypothetical protein
MMIEEFIIVLTFGLVLLMAHCGRKNDILVVSPLALSIGDKVVLPGWGWSGYGRSRSRMNWQLYTLTPALRP